MNNDNTEKFAAALKARNDLFDERHECAFRLFNGFYEGEARLVVDLYGRTLVLQNYADPPAEGEFTVGEAQTFYRQQLPWLRSVILKTRHAVQKSERNGIVVSGADPDCWIREDGIRYALDLQINQDASFYLDTRSVRRWARSQLKDAQVLNTFAYTGSLGVAAMAGGASQVVHLDLKRKFLNVAKASYTLNGYPIKKRDFIQGDFWPQVNQLKRRGELFDCVFLDPPFFSKTRAGQVDQIQNSRRLINKVRPLIRDQGRLVAINNALFLSGQDYQRMLEELCLDGYMQVEELLPVPDDVAIPFETRVNQPPADPSPFNHSTKIVVLRIRRKDGQ